ncbi:MAG: GNAT family N-acetyltransferase [Vulcanimicrobiota bacterium]
MEFRLTRLLLRPLTMEDAGLLAELSQDEGFRDFSTFQPMDAEAARIFLEPRLERCRNGYGLWLALENSHPVGTLQLLPQTLDDRQGLWPELGYRLRRSAWGRGLASEGAARLRDYAHQQLGVERLYAFIDPANGRSQSVARKLAFQPGAQATFKGFSVVLWEHRSGSEDHGNRLA